ncbi:MAG: hypothetical protein ACLUEU_01155 [Oscillospiraceae bacterium]
MRPICDSKAGRTCREIAEATNTWTAAQAGRRMVFAEYRREYKKRLARINAAGKLTKSGIFTPPA